MRIYTEIKMGEKPHLSAVSSDQTLKWPETQRISPFSLLRNRSLSQQVRPNAQCNGFKLALFVCLAAVSLISTCPRLTPSPSVEGISLYSRHAILSVSPGGAHPGTWDWRRFLQRSLVEEPLVLVWMDDSQRHLTFLATLYFLLIFSHPCLWSYLPSHIFSETF